MNKLSVVIITKNEEKFIKDAILSASFADEVLILDSGSSDKTCEIAKSLGARVEYQKWLGFGKQKQKAVNLAKNKWIFVLDSDERITNELKEEILKEIKNPKFDAYFTPRLNNFWGKNIKAWIISGLFYKIRKVRKKKGGIERRRAKERQR